MVAIVLWTNQLDEQTMQIESADIELENWIYLSNLEKSNFKLVEQI